MVIIKTTSNQIKVETQLHMYRQSSVRKEHLRLAYFTLRVKTNLWQPTCIQLSQAYPFVKAWILTTTKPSRTLLTIKWTKILSILLSNSKIFLYWSVNTPHHSLPKCITSTRENYRLTGTAIACRLYHLKKITINVSNKKNCFATVPYHQTKSKTKLLNGQRYKNKVENPVTIKTHCSLH